MRILLADHHASPRWALRTMLQEEPDIELAGESVDGESLLALAEQNRPDLVLIDRDLPGIPIEDLISTLHRLNPKTIVIVMSSDPADSRMLLRVGADAFVSKGEQPDWLITSIKKYIDPTQSKTEIDTINR